jgi:hypothetical protein
VPVEKPGQEGVWCSRCGHDLSSTPRGEPCPECGHTARTIGKNFSVTAKSRATMSKTVGKKIHVISEGKASLGWVHTGERVREYWEKHPGWLALTAVLVVGSPFLGALGIVGWTGVIAGEAAGLLSFGAGLKGLTKVRDRTSGEIARGGDQEGDQ